MSRRHVSIGSARGQAATETMMMMMFLLLMIFGLAHFSMLAATKQMLDYAAFAAARTALVGDGLFGFGAPQQAARQVMDASLRWSNQQANVTGAGCNTTPPGLNRRGLRVQVRVPFGLPIFNNIPAGGLLITSLSPCVVQPDINENGDNAGLFGF